MKFSYHKDPVDPSEAHPSKKWYPRPVIPVWLISPTERLRVMSIIDSGADWCVFQGNIGKALQLEVASGKKQKISGIGAGKITAYFHHIEMDVGDGPFKCYAGFSHDLDKIPYGLLGQDGFFNHYRTTFDNPKGRVEIKRIR